MMNLVNKMERKAFMRVRKSLGDRAPYFEWRGVNVPCLTGELSRDVIAISQSFALDDVSGTIVALLTDFPQMTLPNPENRDEIVLKEVGSEADRLRVETVRRQRGSDVVLMATIKAH